MLPSRTVWPQYLTHWQPNPRSQNLNTVRMVLPSNAHCVVNRWVNLDNGGELSPVAWIAFLDFLRSNTKLKELSLFDSGLSEEQVIELMDVLKDNTALVSIDLSGKTNRFPMLLTNVVGCRCNQCRFPREFESDSSLCGK